MNGMLYGHSGPTRVGLSSSIKTNPAFPTGAPTQVMQPMNPMRSQIASAMAQPQMPMAPQQMRGFSPQRF